LLVYFEPVDMDSIGRLAVPAARRALALDSTLADAHTALALAFCHSYAWGEARQEYLRAVALAPNDAEARIQYGRFLHYTGHQREAFAEFERARRLDPYSAVASGWYGHLMDLRGQHAEGIREMERALEIDSTSPPTLFMMTEAQVYGGHREAARRYAERLTHSVALPQWRVGAAALLARMGEGAHARAMLQQLAAEPRPLPQTPTMRAMLYAGLGDTTHLMDA